MSNPFANKVSDDAWFEPNPDISYRLVDEPDPPREMYYEVRRSDSRFVHLYKGKGAKEKAEKDAKQRNRFAERNDQQVRFHVEEVPKP